MRFVMLALLTCLPACITPNVLDANTRAVALAPAQVVWTVAQPADFRGLFESTSIEGEAAASLWKIYYHFADDGTFTGAALVSGGAQPEFQTLSGHWSLDERGLELGDGQRVRASAAPDQLRFESEGGTAILRRVAVQ